MTAWREQSFWSKYWVWAWLAFMTVFIACTGAFWLGDGSSYRKRVFSLASLCSAPSWLWLS